MHFLKNNIPLIAAVIVTVILSITLIILDFSKYIAYLNAKEETEQNVIRIHDVTKKKPAPLNENVKAIGNDIIFMNQKTAELQRMFGKFYREPMKKFASDIGTTESDLLQDFAEYYNALPAEKKPGITGETDAALLEDFLKRYYMQDPEELKAQKSEQPKGKKGSAPVKNDKAAEVADAKPAELTDAQKARKKKVDDALSAFSANIQTVALDYDKNGYAYLLDALGLPRTELATLFQQHLIQVNNKLIENNLIPGITEKDKIENFTFSVTAIPPQREIYLACRQLQILTDLYRRIKDKKISLIVKLERPASLAGTKVEDSYLKYTYVLEVEGTMNAIRELINSLLNDAVKQNLIYNVRSVTLMRPNAEDIDKLASADSESIRDKDGKLSSGYGRTVIGASQMVHCKMMIDFIMYVGDLLERQAPGKQ